MDGRGYRGSIYRYERRLLVAKFKKYIADEDRRLRVGYDSTPMRIYTPREREGDVEIHVRALDAYAVGGASMELLPEILRPSSKTTSGILSTIPISGSLIEDLVASGTAKTITPNCDGTNANNIAIRMITSELRNLPNLLVFANICDAHGLINSPKWGLGVIPTGPLCALVMYTMALEINQNPL